MVVVGLSKSCLPQAELAVAGSVGVPVGEGDEDALQEGAGKNAVGELLGNERSHCGGYVVRGGRGEERFRYNAAEYGFADRLRLGLYGKFVEHPGEAQRFGTDRSCDHP